MTTSLPTDFSPSAATPFLRDFGTVLTPFLGGPEQRINRIGTRFGIRVSVPPMLSADKGRVLVSRLLQAREDRLLMKWPLLEFDPGTPGTPLVSADVSGGTAVALKGLTSSYQAKEGQFISFVHSGRRYVHMITGDGTANGSGNLSIGIYPMLRTNLDTDDVVEIETPYIEGHVMPGDELSWDFSIEHLVELSFSISEAA